MSDKLERAIRLREEGKYEEARKLLLVLQSQNPHDAFVNYQCTWVHDVMGEERVAVPLYEKVIANGLDGDDLRGAMLGLGSTYRTLGKYQKAIALLREGIQRFEDSREFEVFLAMALYNIGEHKKAMEILLHNLAETTQHEAIKRYQKAIGFYADKLDRIWE